MKIQLLVPAECSIQGAGRVLSWSKYTAQDINTGNIHNYMSCAKNSDIFLWLAVGWKGALQKTLKYTPDPGSHIQ